MKHTYTVSKRNGGDSNIWKATKFVFRERYKKKTQIIRSKTILFWISIFDEAWRRRRWLAKKESCHHHHHFNCSIALTLIVCGGSQGNDDGTLKIHLKLFLLFTMIVYMTTSMCASLTPVENGGGV